MWTLIQKRIQTYHVIPVAAVARNRTRSQVFEAESLVEWNQMVVSKQCQLFGGFRVFNPGNVRFHQNRTKAHLLKLWCDGHGVDANGPSLVLVAERFLGIIIAGKR